MSSSRTRRDASPSRRLTVAIFGRVPTDQPVAPGHHKSAPLHWSADGRYVYVTDMVPGVRSQVAPGLPLQVDRLDVRTGRREPWRQIAIDDPAGIDGAATFIVTPDQRAYAYSYGRILCTLQLVEGLR